MYYLMKFQIMNMNRLSTSALKRSMHSKLMRGTNTKEIYILGRETNVIFIGFMTNHSTFSLWFLYASPQNIRGILILIVHLVCDVWFERRNLWFSKIKEWTAAINEVFVTVQIAFSVLLQEPNFLLKVNVRLMLLLVKRLCSNFRGIDAPRTPSIDMEKKWIFHRHAQTPIAKALINCLCFRFCCQHWKAQNIFSPSHLWYIGRFHQLWEDEDYTYMLSSLSEWKRFTKFSLSWNSLPLLISDGSDVYIALLQFLLIEIDWFIGHFHLSDLYP